MSSKFPSVKYDGFSRRNDLPIFPPKRGPQRRKCSKRGNNSTLHEIRATYPIMFYIILCCLIFIIAIMMIFYISTELIHSYEVFLVYIYSIRIIARIINEIVQSRIIEWNNYIADNEVNNNDSTDNEGNNNNTDNEGSNY